MQSGQLKAAERVLKDILRADATQFDALLTYGVLSGMRGDFGDAVKHLTRAARKRPTSDEALYNLGQALIKLGRHADAADALTSAAALADLPQIHEKLGDCLRQLGRLDEAVAHFSRAVILTSSANTPSAPRDAMLLSSLVETKRRLCDWTGLAELEASLVERVSSGMPAEPLLMLYVSDDPDLHHRNATAYARDFLAPMLPPEPARPRFAHAPRERTRLRIGYLCSDFRNHATAHLIAGMIEQHDRTRFEIIALSLGPDDKSAIRRRLVAAFDRFEELRNRSSEEIARKIHALGIDILVDLNGYIVNARPEILAARAAPVQCHYLAFPGTLGGDAIDYMIVDPTVAPPGEERYFTEALVRLPDTYQANDRRRPVAGASPSRASCGLPETGVVLCSFNAPIKLSPAIFDVWMRMLSATPGGVLWLFADHVSVEANLRREASMRGVDPARLVFARYVAPEEHLARSALADLFLDTHPYGAHTTASDALWMGLPVLTITGRSFASRVGTSLLLAAGHAELSTPDLSSYEALAIALARNPAHLDALKRKLAATRDTCALFDTPRFTRHLEAAYLEMWARWKRGATPENFDVAPIT